MDCLDDIIAQFDSSTSSQLVPPFVDLSSSSSVESITSTSRKRKAPSKKKKATPTLDDMAKDDVELVPDEEVRKPPATRSTLSSMHIDRYIARRRKEGHNILAGVRNLLDLGFVKSIKTVPPEDSDTEDLRNTVEFEDSSSGGDCTTIYRSVTHVIYDVEPRIVKSTESLTVSSTSSSHSADKAELSEPSASVVAQPAPVNVVASSDSSVSRSEVRTPRGVGRSVRDDIESRKSGHTGVPVERQIVVPDVPSVGNGDQRPSVAQRKEEVPRQPKRVYDQPRKSQRRPAPLPSRYMAETEL